VNGLRKAGKRAILGTLVSAEASLKAVGLARPSVLLLLGHMRSGSTLLLHLLMTNPEIAALGERGVVYDSSADFARLALAARIRHGGPLRVLRYVADQVNHDELTPHASLLRHRRVKVLFLLRRPEPSLRSIVELYRAHYQQPWSTSRALEYYVGRVKSLTRLGQSLSAQGNAALIRYESLTDAPQETLEALRVFLGLRRGFSPTYATYPFTGRHGDPGPYIHAGRIIRERSATRIDLASSELERAAAAYDECTTALERFTLGV